eukprot:2650144-Rhodomonas_salina.1
MLPAAAFHARQLAAQRVTSQRSTNTHRETTKGIGCRLERFERRRSRRKVPELGAAWENAGVGVDLAEAIARAVEGDGRLRHPTLISASARRRIGASMGP